MIKGVGSLPYEQRLRESVLFSLEKRLKGDFITMFQYLNGGYNEGGGSLFSRSHGEEMKGNEYKLLLEGFQLDIRWKLFTRRVISFWNNLSRKVVDSSVVDTFEIQLDRVSCLDRKG